jgi:hypothetical protein
VRLRLYCANGTVEVGKKRSEPNRRTALSWFVSEKAEDNYEDIQKRRSLSQNLNLTTFEHKSSRMLLSQLAWLLGVMQQNKGLDLERFMNYYKVSYVNMSFPYILR